MAAAAVDHQPQGLNSAGIRFKLRAALGSKGVDGSSTGGGVAAAPPLAKLSDFPFSVQFPPGYRFLYRVKRVSSKLSFN